MKQYLLHTPVDGLKTFTWTLVRHIDNPTLLERALSWMKHIYAEEDNYATRQTEAGLLYQLGRTEEAIRLQEKIVSDAHEFRRKLYEDKLIIMKEGKPLFDDSK